MQLAPELSCFLFSVAIRGNRQGILIDLAYCMDGGIYFVNSPEIGLSGSTQSIDKAGIQLITLTRS